MPRKGNGFTVIELLFSILIIGLGLLGMLLANTAIHQSTEKSYERVVATQDANRVIELMRNASAAGNFPQNVTAAFPNGTAVAGFNNLPGEAVTVTYAAPNADPLDVTVTTTWLEQGLRNTLTQLRTLMTDRN